MESAQYLRSLLEALKGKRYTNISQLAEQAGVPQGNLSAFMKGKRNQLSFDTVWRIFIALGIELPHPDNPQPRNDHSWEKERIRQLEKQLAKTEGRLEGLEKAIGRGWIDARAPSISEKSYESSESSAGHQDVG